MGNVEEGEGRINVSKWLSIVGMALVLIAVALLILFFLRGDTTIKGDWTTTKSEHIACSINGVQYPFFTYDETRNKTIKVNAIFRSEKMDSISLLYTMYYDNDKSIVDSNNLNHIALNNSYFEHGLGFDALNTKFSKFPEGLQFSISANADEINNASMRYFMLQSYNGEKIGEVKEKYEAQGFACEISNNQKEENEDI